LKDIYIESLTPDTGTLDLYAQVAQADRKDTKGGKPYLNLTLRDRTGEVSAKYWDVPADVQVRAGDFVKVRAESGSYKDALQLKVKLLKVVDRADISIDDFLPASKRDRAEMFTELLNVAYSISEDRLELRCAITNILNDHRDEVMNAPAARKMHQAYLGGLLEHTLNLCWLVCSVCNVYQDLNRDVLLAGAILHDIGKIFEYRYQDDIGSTRPGQLLGHIVLGSMMWEKYRADVDPATADHVAHIIISHHGQREWGSPVLPATREAQVFHQLDMIDSRMAIATEALAAQPVDADGFTGKIYALDTALWNGGKAA
jgi:3'-5' exoribonuclease